MLSKYFRNNKGKTEFLPQLEAKTLPDEKWKGGLGSLKCAERNCAFIWCLQSLKPEKPRVMVIDSAENTSMFHCVAGFENIEIAAVSKGVNWKPFSDERVDINPFHSTFDAYLDDSDEAFDGVFLDACGCAPNLLGDICGIHVIDKDTGKLIRDEQGNLSYVSAFESLNEKGGVFGITWQNSRQRCTKKNILAASQGTDRANDCILGFTDARGVFHKGYGAFEPIDDKNYSDDAEEKKNDERHYDWMLGLFRHMAAEEGFRLRLFYSKTNPGCMRTVIFRAYPIGTSLEPLPRPPAFKLLFNVYETIENETWDAHEGILAIHYISSILKDKVVTDKEKNTDSYKELQRWVNQQNWLNPQNGERQKESKKRQRDNDSPKESDHKRPLIVPDPPSVPPVGVEAAVSVAPVSVEAPISYKIIAVKGDVQEECMTLSKETFEKMFQCKFYPFKDQ